MAMEEQLAVSDSVIFPERTQAYVSRQGDNPPVTGSGLILEDGAGFLLLESGSYLLLED